MLILKNAKLRTILRMVYERPTEIDWQSEEQHQQFC